MACNQTTQKEEEALSGRFVAQSMSYFYGLDIVPEESVIKFYVPSKWNSKEDIAEQVEYMDWSFSWSAHYRVENGIVMIESDNPEVGEFTIEIVDRSIHIKCADLKRRYVGGNTIDFCKTQNLVFAQ